MKGARDAADAVHRAFDRKIERDYRGRVGMAYVRAVSPLRLELDDAEITLDEGDDLNLSQFLRWWISRYGISLGDTVLVTEVREAVWMAFDVRPHDLSTDPILAGVRPGGGTAAEGTLESDAPTATEAGLFTVSAGSVSIPEGGGSDTPSITTTWHHHLSHKLPVYNKAGTRIGWVPVFTDLP